MWLTIFVIVGVLSHVLYAALDKNTNVTKAEETTIPEKSVDVDPKALLEQKVANLTRALRYRPFEMPSFYNRLQIPNFSFIYARSLETPGFLSEAKISQMEASGSLAQRVEMRLKVKYITEVNEINEEITFAADLTLNWNDPLIYVRTLREFGFTEKEAYALRPELTEKLYKTLDSDIMSQIWKPDIFIENTVKIDYPELMSRPLTVRLNELVGQVFYAARLRVQMECEMDFHYYPADTQTCHVLLRSNSYSKEELNLTWADEFSASLEYCGGSGFDYQITQVGTFEEQESYLKNSTRKFIVLRFSILARRKLSYHIVQTFLPSVFFIVITWLCFLLPSVEARIGVSMTTLLTLTAMFASVRENSPKVTYVRAIDIWMLACVVFVFLTLIEFTTILWTRDKKCKMGTLDPKDKNAIVIRIQDDEDAATELNPLNCKIEAEHGDEDDGTHCNCSEFVEQRAMLLFSSIFIFFCILFWGWLMNNSGYIDWNVDRNFNCAGDNPKK